MTKNYFVTGGTGVIGSALIRLLLEDANCRIWALMRGESKEHLKRRLEELITFFSNQGVDKEDIRNRVIPVMGEMSEPEFGIDRPQYEEIAESCDSIIHCAGVVRMNLPLEEARRHAVGSAKNLVALALACRVAGNLRKVEFVSTVGVMGRMQGVAPETWIQKPREFHNTYEASKAEAEDYVRDQIERHDLPITVHRPSMVIGDSLTGEILHFQIFYHLCEFLSGRRTAGIFPPLEQVKLDTVPVDYVAQAIKWSVNSNITHGQVFHLCAGRDQAIEILRLRRLVRQQFAAAGFQLSPIIPLSARGFTMMLQIVSPFLTGKLKRAVKTLPIFLDYLTDQQVFANEGTRLFFNENKGPELPAADDSIIRSLEYYLKRKI